jgi:uncharacterized protein (TIGR02145 family)/uncharacterized repeat protein (TIGR01451 family)
MKKLALLFVFVQSLVFANDPVITLNGDSVIEIYMGSTFVDPGATAYDEEDGDITNSIQVSGSVDTNTHGTYVLAYNVTDSDGNSAAVVVRTINVVDNFNPSLALTITASFSGNDDVPDIGDTITYDIILSNTGNTDLVEFITYVIASTDFNGNGVTLTTQPIFVSSSYSDNGYSIPGEQHIYRATYLVGQDVYDSGGLTLLLRGHGYWQYESIVIDEELTLSFGTSSDEIVLNGQISANNNQIKKVADPTDNLDAVNKRYVDQRTLEQTIPGQNIGDLLYWNGQGWQKLSAPQEQSTLRFCDGQLTWGPCKATIEQSYEIEEFQNSLTIKTNINPNGSTIYSEAKAYYSTSPNIIYSDEFSLEINNGWTLEPRFYLSKQNATTYFFQLYINSSEGEYYSETFEYTTAPQDQNGNAIFSKTYGNQEWSTQSANVTTYRDGTPIPEVTNPGEWANLTTGAWCYYDNDSTKGRLYNWYAVAGINDNDPNTPTKEFAPEGWHVPTDAEWSTLENYLIDNGYNYDGTTTGNKIAKAMANDWGWSEGDSLGAVGNNQSSNNRSGFNAYPLGYRGYWEQGSFIDIGNQALFWSSTSSNGVLAWYFRLSYNLEFSDLTPNDSIWKQGGMQVRFVKD